MSEYRALKIRRGTIKGTVTRMLTFFDSPGEKTAAEAEIRLAKIQECWDTFESVQTQLDTMPTENDEILAQHLVEGEAERQLFEQSYYKAAGKAQAIIDQERIAREQQNPNQLRDERQGLPQQQEEQEQQRQRPKLPVLELYKFDGDLNKWKLFKDNFETAVHEDVTMPDQQKHRYLISALEGEALSVIQGYKITKENYVHAWKLLKETYDNDVIIIENHLDELLNFPVIAKDNKAESIRQFVWHIRTHMTSLQSLGQPAGEWEPIILHLAKKKIDFVEQRDWQNSIKDRTSANMPTMEEFLKFLTDRSNTLRFLNQGKPKQFTSKPPEKGKSGKKFVLASTTITRQECKFCKGSHSIYKCEELQKLSAADRKKEVIGKKLCVNCLGSGHFARECKSSSCKKCSQRHNTLLHRDTEADSKDNSEQEASAVISHCAEASTSNSRSSTNNECEEDRVSIYYTQRRTSSDVILSTARVNAYDRDGNPHECRVLLDPGSQSNLMTESFAKKLRLSTRTEHRAISGVNQARTSAGKVTDVRIESIDEGFTTDVECLILPTITEQLPQTKIDVTRILIPKNLRLADPVFDKPDIVDLLLGAGLYWKILMGKPKKRVQGQPALQNTRLGWIVGGEIPGKQAASSTAHLAVTNEMLNNQLERFWKQEELPETRQYTDEEKYCEKYFSDTVKRDSVGRFIVWLPKRQNIVLGESKEQAIRWFIFLERRFERDAKFKREYVAFMEDYLAQNHMSLSQNISTRELECYVVPHQAVVRPDSVTTKLRVVFDASAKTTLGTLLNDKLMSGPKLQKDLVDIILRFRTHPYVMTADVAIMYRQIIVDKKDCVLQRIVWRKDPQQPLQLYDLDTATYGTTCAPNLAIRCLRELAAESRDLPRAAEAINEDCYMDDVLTGANSIEEAIELQQQLSELMSRGQFPLRKWRANHPRILANLNERCKTDGLLTLDKEGVQKTLGLLWNAQKTVFDPLGLIAPVLINGKIIKQRLWSRQLDWDQDLPGEDLEDWKRYYDFLPKINELRIPRNAIAARSSNQFDIFGFGDASEKAYGACLYAVSFGDENEVQSHLIRSKSKVAPLKVISVPRLELQAALLLANLSHTVKMAYGDRVREVKLWSDSTIVLGWIKTQPNILKTFVANRISKIQGLTTHATWHHVPSEHNPADMLSRGITVDRLIGDELWWHGPRWIADDNPWPEGMQDPEIALPELKPVTVTLTATTEDSILKRFSSYRKLKRVIGYCLRWRKIQSHNAKNHVLNVNELENAEKTIAKMVQRETFAQEINDLRNHREVHNKSTLRALDPILDSEGVMRVGGRLRNADLSEGQKHQIILPPKHFITNLIMKDEHVRLHHCPPTQLLSAVRYKFWPVSGRREANKVVKACLPCFRFRPTFPEVKMGNLPTQRVTGFKGPFVSTGIDYAGPIQIRESRRRGRIHIYKGYVAVFTCFSTKAVHLELVTELTTEAFLAALRRFTARQGICSQLFSDNATNFVRAARELKEIYDFLEKEKKEIETNLANQHVQWNFIPPRAPNFGGLWEAAVKVTKRHLYTTTQGLTLTYEEYSTLLTEIEAILNSRPLTPLSSDPADFSVLTPSHFLIGDPLIQPEQYNLTEVPDNRLSRWQHLQKLRQLFWRRRQTEYLQELQKRSKWTRDGTNIELDTLVLIKEDNLSPLQWNLGRIVELFPGPDGVVRVVSVRNQNGTFKRSVRNLCPIPKDDDFSKE